MDTTHSPFPAGLAPRETGKPPDDFADLVACALPYLNDGRSQSWEVVWFRRKLRKVIVEFNVAMEDSLDASPRQVIGKIYHGDRGRGSFDALSQLWQAGFRPPSLFTVVRPIAYIADRGLLLQEKALGRPLADALLADTDPAASALARTAGWLAALHATTVDAPVRVEHVRTAVARYGRELAELLAQQASRLERLTASALAGLEAPQLTPLVPSHGDFHPKNVFIADSGRVTAIDLDTFGRQEQAADVAYFLVQTAIRGYFHQGRFSATAWAQQCFLCAYLEVAPSLPSERLPLYLGIGFLQSLHYELCVLHTGNAAVIEPWLHNADRCLLNGEVDVA